MLSSAKKSVPTVKQFVQPYFIQIAPTGAIAAVCHRFDAVLQKRNVHNYLGNNVIEIFRQFGALHPALDAGIFNAEFSGSALPGVFDLHVSGTGSRPLVIRWTPVPSYDEGAGGWQLNGMRIAADAPGRTQDPGLSADQLHYHANLSKWVSDIIIATDLEDRVSHWNKAAEKFYGIPGRQAIGRPLRELTGHEHLDANHTEVDRLLREQGYWEGEITWLSPNGKKSYLLSSVRHLRDSEERITGLLTVNKDITENKQAQDEILRIKTAIDNTSDAISITDINFKIIYQNSAHQKLFRRTTRQWNSENGILACIKPSAGTRRLTTNLQHGLSWSGEVLAYDKQGAAIDISLRTDSIQNLKGEAIGYIWSFTDNRERQRTEAQLRLYSEQIANIFESITDGFFVLDRAFRVELWNREAERITGRSTAEMVGNILWEKLPYLTATEVYTHFHKALRKKTTISFEQYNLKVDRWMELNVYPSVQGLFVYFKEVTVRKKQEAMLALEKKVLELNSNKKNSLQTILNYFLKELEKMLPSMFGSVLTLDDDGLSIRHLSAPRLPAVYSHAIDGLPIGPASGSCGTAMYRKERVIVSDIQTDPLWSEARELAMQFGLRACWSWPVLNAKGEVLASFAAYYSAPRTPSEMETDLLDRAANLIRIIMESYRAEEELKISHDRYTLATKATNDAIWDWDLHTGQYFWGEGFYQQFGYKSGAKVQTRKFWEDHIHPDDRARIIKDMEKFIQRKDKGLWLEEYRFRRSDGKYALISDRGFLVFGKERKLVRMIGSMQDITEKREMETRLLKQELNKQKLVARAMVDAQEKERAEIGKELHDNVNQILSTTKLYLELAKNDHKERLSLINRSAKNIGEAIHEIRNISRSLVPRSIGDLGLVDSIKDLVESIRPAGSLHGGPHRSLHVEFYPVGRFDERIGDKLKLMLFRIIQEQVNNVLKHAEARTLIIELIMEEGDNAIDLNITDDGKGFLPGQIKNKKGLGLSNIVSRADLFGGTVTLVSAPGEGCKLRVQVPV